MCLFNLVFSYKDCDGGLNFGSAETYMTGPAFGLENVKEIEKEILENEHVGGPVTVHNVQSLPVIHPLAKMKGGNNSGLTYLFSVVFSYKDYDGGLNFGSAETYMTGPAFGLENMREIEKEILENEHVGGQVTVHNVQPLPVIHPLAKMEGVSNSTLTRKE